MTDVPAGKITTDPSVLARAGRAQVEDRVFLGMTWLSAVIVVVLLLGVIVALTVESWEAISKFGLAFVWTERWSPPCRRAIVIPGSVIGVDGGWLVTPNAWTIRTRSLTKKREESRGSTATA